MAGFESDRNASEFENVNQEVLETLKKIGAKITKQLVKWEFLITISFPSNQYTLDWTAQTGALGFLDTDKVTIKDWNIHIFDPIANTTNIINSTELQALGLKNQSNTYQNALWVSEKLWLDHMFKEFIERKPSYVNVLAANSMQVILQTKAWSTTRWGSIETNFNASEWVISLNTNVNDPFNVLKWENTTLNSLDLTSDQVRKLSQLEYGLDSIRDIAYINTKNGDNTIIIPSMVGDGFITICASWSINIYNKDSPVPAGGVVRKPVIYLYPKEKSKISISVELTGAEMIAEYPKTHDGKWTVEATPRGNLTDTKTGKKYSYLFWEAEKKWGFTFDAKNAHCISSGEVESYPEKSLKTLGLNTRETNDFIVYWLPVLEKNLYSLIEWKTTEYTDMAKLHISPKPETLIRVFMVFRWSDTPVKTGNPKLQKAKRKWYSVIEWGGTNMDEKTAIK